MGLADSIAASAKKPGGKCTVGEVRAALSADDQQALDDAVNNRRVSIAAIIEGLRLEGHEITRSPVERHRRGECACGSR